MKKYLRTKATGKLGVTFVESVVSEGGSIFRETPQDTDVGIDGYIASAYYGERNRKMATR